MRAFLTGASGFVGGHVLRALEERGREVVCLLRPDSDRRNLAGSEARVVLGDLTRPESFSSEVRGCTEVYHCAADYRLFVRRPREMYATNVDGTRRVLRAAADAGVERVVYTSSVGALGLGQGEAAADESTPVAFGDMVGHYKRSKFLAEREAEAWVERGLPLVIVNPSTPVGDGDLKPTPTGRIILDFLCRRTPAYVETGLNLVDVRDVAVGHLLAAEKGRIGEKYILGHENLSLGSIFEMLSRLTGLPTPRLRLPHAVPIMFAGLATAKARLFGGQPRVALEAALLARYKMYFSAEKAVRELGLPQTSVCEALGRAVDWFRANGYANSDAGSYDDCGD